MIYIIIDLLILQEDPYANSYQDLYYLDNERSPSNNILPVLDERVNNTYVEQNISISKEIQKNIDKIKMIEQFNPQIEEYEEIIDIKPVINKKTKTKKKPNQAKNQTKQKTNYQKPKLAIIIDDVVFLYQAKKIKQLALDITPSFIPSVDKKTAKEISSLFQSYMIHLPLEAMGGKAREKITINANASFKTIDKMVARGLSLFPDANFLNNHTGSKFTSNKKAMIKLGKSLKSHNIKFLDSLTTPKSKARAVFGKDMYVRNIFLDHFDNLAHIKERIKKAISVAKRDGYSIALGHPRQNTMKALREYTNLLKSQVDVVFIDDLNML